jgi:hypothetical protein
VDPGVKVGLYTPEEVSDFTPVDTPLERVEPVKPAQPLLAAPEPPPVAMDDDVERGQLADLLHADLADSGLLDAALVFIRDTKMVGAEGVIADLPLMTLRGIHERKDAFIAAVRARGQAAA